MTPASLALAPTPVVLPLMQLLVLLLTPTMLPTFVSNNTSTSISNTLRLLFYTPFILENGFAGVNATIMLLLAT